MSYKHIRTADELKQMTEANTWVLLDFWAMWCGPCKSMGPVFEKVLDTKNGDITGAKVDVDKAQQLAGEFKVRAIPTLVLLKNGEVFEQRVGALSERELHSWIDSAIKNVA